MKTEESARRNLPTRHTRRPNISTENQPAGAARRPSDTLDRQPDKDGAAARRAHDGH